MNVEGSNPFARSISRQPPTHSQTSAAHPTGNVVGTAELRFTHVENTARASPTNRAIDERYYNRVESALDELAALFRGAAG